MHKRLLFAIAALAVLAGCKALEPDSGLRGVVSPHAQVELVKGGFVFTEGPLPMADGGLLFSDLRASRIYRLDLIGDIKLHRGETNATNGLAYTPRGELLAAESGAGRISVTARDGSVREATRGDGVSALASVNDSSQMRAAACISPIPTRGRRCRGRRPPCTTCRRVSASRASWKTRS